MNNKIIIPLLLASLTGGVVATAKQQTVVQASQINENVSNVIGELVSVTNFSNHAKLSDGEVLLPIASSTIELKTTVTDPTQRVLSNDEIKTKTVNGVQRSYFEPKLAGYYTVVYSTVSNSIVSTVSSPLKIFVESSNYSLTLPTNSKYVIPTTIGKSTDVARALQIPAPSIWLDGEVQDFDDLKSNLKVSVVKRNSSGSAEVLTGAYDSENADKTFVYKWQPSTDGIFDIIYEYVDGTTHDRKTQSVVVKDGFKVSDIELDFSYASSKPTTAVLGVETKLPKINIINKKNGNAIEGQTVITVTHFESGETFKVLDYKFTPTKKGKYLVTYQAKIDYFGLGEGVTNSFIINDVKDTKAPTPLVVNPYVVKDGEIDKIYNFENISEVLYDAEVHGLNKTTEEKQKLIEKALSKLDYAVKSVDALGADNKVTVTFPAIFATDNFSAFNKMTYTRTVYKNTGGLTSTLQKVSEEQNADFNEIGKVVLDEAGDYTVRYEVRDEAGNVNSDRYDLKVVASASELLIDADNNKVHTPTINMQALPSYVKANGKISFAVPTATDKFDTRVNVKAFYAFDTDRDDLQEIKVSDDNKYELELSELTIPSTAKSIIIVTKAYNDYAGVSQVERIVKLINTVDNDLPTFVNDSTFLDDLSSDNGLTGEIGVDGYVDGQYPFEQNQKIKLPEIIISDLTDPNLEVGVTVRDPYGKIVPLLNSVYEYNTENGVFEFSLKNGEFTLNYSGLYTVSYTAKDAGGNIIIKTYGIRVKDTLKPTILLNSFDPFNKEYEVGELIEIPGANLKDNGEILEKVSFGYDGYKEFEEVNGVNQLLPGIAWKLVKGPTPSELSNSGFRPVVAGEYVVSYIGWDKTDNKTETRNYTLVVKDTIKPTIELEKDLYLNNKVEYVQGQVVEIEGYEKLFDGKVEGNNPDNHIIQDGLIEFNVTVTFPNGTKVNADKVSERSSNGVQRYSFKPNAQGTYTVEYTAIDSVGNTTEIRRSIIVGDAVAPELSWEAGYELASKVDLNKKFTLNWSKAIITDTDSDEEGMAYIDEHKVIKLKYPNSSRVVTNILEDSKGYEWILDEVGTYELEITLKDKAGQVSETIVHRVTVAEKETETKSVSSWVGTVLIILSVVVLGGVVGYFVLTSRTAKLKSAQKKSRRRTTKK